MAGMTTNDLDRTGRLGGRAALIVGAASGMGLETALLFADEGADLCLADLDAEAGERVAEESRSRGVKASFVRCDITKDGDVRAAVDAAVATLGRLDTLIITAGGGADGFAATYALNVIGQAVTVETARPHLAESGRGAVVFVGSISGIVSHAGSAAYSAAKAGLLGYSRTLAAELAPQGIRVNTVCPGGTLTPMLENGWRRAGHDPAEQAKAQLRNKPLGRWGTGRDIAQAIAFLASDDASYITGISLNVDGGEYLNVRS